MFKVKSAESRDRQMTSEPLRHSRVGVVGVQTRSYRRPRFDPVKPCLACGDECSVVLPGYSSMSVWEEIGVKRLRVRGRGNGGGIRRAYFCKRCRHVFTEASWYVGRFLLDKGEQVELVQLKRRSFLYELRVNYCGWYVPVDRLVEMHESFSKAEFTVLANLWGGIFSFAELCEMYCPGRAMVFQGPDYFRPEQEVWFPTFRHGNRRDILKAFFRGALYFWEQGVCSDNDRFRIMLDLFNTEVRTSQPPVDLWDADWGGDCLIEPTDPSGDGMCAFRVCMCLF